MVKKAGWFHHSGRLRFSFQNLALPEVAGLLVPSPSAAPSDAPRPPEERILQVRTQGTLSAAEGDRAPLKVDSEGGVQATESKTRFIGTAIALLVAAPPGITIRFVLHPSAALEALSSGNVRMSAVVLSEGDWVSDC